MYLLYAAPTELLHSFLHGAAIKMSLLRSLYFAGARADSADEQELVPTVSATALLN